MKASLIYRIAAGLLLLFAVGHTLSFSLVDPSWGLDAMMRDMHSIRFAIGGTERTYWDLFLAAGQIVGIFYLFSAVLAWQLGSLTPETLREMRLVRWAFSLTYVAVTAVSMIHLFPIPIAFSAVIAFVLALAARRS